MWRHLLTKHKKAKGHLSKRHKSVLTCSFTKGGQTTSWGVKWHKTQLTQEKKITKTSILYWTYKLRNVNVEKLKNKDWMRHFLERIQKLFQFLLSQNLTELPTEYGQLTTTMHRTWSQSYNVTPGSNTRTLPGPISFSTTNQQLHKHLFPFAASHYKSIAVAGLTFSILSSHSLFWASSAMKAWCLSHFLWSFWVSSLLLSLAISIFSHTQSPSWRKREETGKTCHGRTSCCVFNHLAVKRHRCSTKAHWCKLICMRKSNIMISGINWNRP